MSEDHEATGRTLASRLGTIGLWAVGLRADDASRVGEVREAAAELEELGYGALWVGGNPSLEQIAPLLEATTRVTVGTSILSIWDHEAPAVAAGVAALPAGQRERFLLGLGASHSHLAKDYARPYTTMRRYLDALDAAPVPLPAGQRLLAALGPKMLELARDRAAGALPYLVTAEHTAQARERLGEGPLLAPELKVVLDTDPARARERARAYLGFYLPMPNYRNNLLRLGFTEDDFAGDGSDRLVEALFALGDGEAVRARVDAFLAAGADHVALQVVPEGDPRTTEPPRALWRTLAEELALGNGH
ncbi:LLM class F420-dependent oxidoreductase [Streptomyces mashuensis]|uniref:LLM class F420-dependent oxidoreductase n=1 Tax=Streptomyces mashuensis TaxID=33904 RepID=A0A919B1J5_9ACTN|nr:LLM class F420-dependent oxidoreductase [Streptomyces mashuensis]GHF42264.1 LLM class F420-dependent oxidoreductase [Streptomyces mashuensis]